MKLRASYRPWAAGAEGIPRAGEEVVPDNGAHGCNGRAWFDAVLTHMTVLPLSPSVIVDALRLPDFPNRNHGDELIVATARIHKWTLLTTNSQLKGYRYARIHYFTPTVDRSVRGE